ncbi:hypothetical protein LWI29_008801 [Acer saccharum]|uniref:Uncharacterized protein n=1 Tax=Acer saccharum TaxID=4024 RepID=A0AA39TD76_ACESA|nr:hypothetical protein LWI29_008801 [Acer saccharum]
MDFYGRHTYAYERDANHAQASGREQEDVVVCELCHVNGHEIESCPLTDEFPVFCRQHSQKLKSYNPEPTNTFGDCYNTEPHYKPYNNSYNQDKRPHQDSSWKYNEANAFEQPTSSHLSMTQSFEEKMKDFMRNSLRENEQILTSQQKSQAYIQKQEQKWRDELKDDNELKVGMQVHSDDESYNLCNTYALRKGFSIRKGHIRKDKSNNI